MALVFPVVWRLLDLYGIAKIDLAFDDIIRHKVVVVPYFLQDSRNMSYPLSVCEEIFRLSEVEPKHVNHIKDPMTHCTQLL